jgi:hypothetical protein
MSSGSTRSEAPRAVIHKRILDVAESRPDAPLATIADEVSGASTDLVERVLAEYGDPSAGTELPDSPAETATSDDPTDHDAPDATGDGTGDDDNAEPLVGDGHVLENVREGRQSGEDQSGEGASDDAVDGRDAGDAVRDDIPDRTVEALRVLHENPGASQSDLAEHFGVAASTMNRWLNSVPEFDWEERHAFAEAVVEGGESEPSRSTDASVQRLRRRVSAVERRVEQLAGDGGQSSLDTDLVPKVVHACVESDRFSEEEELRVIESLVGYR